LSLLPVKKVETKEIPLKVNSTIVNVKKYEGDLLTCLRFFSFCVCGVHLDDLMEKERKDISNTTALVILRQSKDLHQQSSWVVYGTIQNRYRYVAPS